MSIAHASTEPVVDQADVERRMSFADAALGAAGHEITDPAVRAISRRLAAGEVTGDEAAALVKAQLLGSR
ncbi:antitoxin VbhA family protein [Herbiconiux daphne]|uniref:Antitoxin VbhA family protein n=1 Tax=Herbiconiux daphne TaxID=2970914 RepID=A0ABT2H6T0_9MICO|nr:antitoxin VbhA family protein [Herbiconiux daphne]MCS5735670.1 antitoxin VbhA family protein [Herbiconiux daphne]